MFLRGIRGATTTTENTREAILIDTKALLSEMIATNEIQVEDIASIFFSVTKDLDAEFPAAAAREMGLQYTPLLCLNEISVPGRLEKCIRVLIHVNTPKKQNEIQHIYLKQATVLRPDHTRSFKAKA